MELVVVLCTYNGAAYLPALLAGMLAQSRLPARLVVRDDGSSDATVDLLQSFAAAAPFAVDLTLNGSTLGSTANFAAALAEAAASSPNALLVLADQDDLWRADKLERLAAACADPTVGAVFSDAELVDDDLQPYPYLLWQAAGFGPRERALAAEGRLFEVLLRHNVVTGATLACRAELITKLLPIPGEWIHDAWMALLLAAVSKVVAVDAPLIRYRQHAGQQHGAPRWKLSDRLRHALRTGGRELATQRRLAEDLRRSRLIRQQLLQLGAAPALLALLDAKLNHLDTRAGLHRRSLLARCLPALAELPGYRRFANGWATLLKDVVFS